MKRRHTPREVLPAPISKALPAAPYWFVIGGHAVRCFCPYRPSRDVDFGVTNAKSSRELLEQLRSKGKVETRERSKDTVHLTFDGIDVSIFVLPQLARHVDDRALSLDGVLATKLHAILDRGTRRDFFDLYVMLQQHRLGIVECLRAIREVYETEVNDGLVLRALTYFDDAEAEAPLPGEGRQDWASVKAFFVASAGALLLPPQRELAIQALTVDVIPSSSRAERQPGQRRRTKAKRSKRP